MNEEWIVCLYFRQRFDTQSGIAVDSKFERFTFTCEELADKAIEALSVFEPNNNYFRIAKFRTK